MKIATAAALLVAASCSALPAQEPSPPKTQSVRFYLGERMLDEDDWEPVEDQGTFGVEYVQEPVGSIGWEVGFMASQEEDDVDVLGVDVDVEGTTAELYGGVRKTFGAHAARVAPYIGGGLSYFSAELDVDALGLSADADDSSFGGYAHAGVTFDVTESFFVGIDLRLLFGTDLEFEGVDGDGDYEQVALVLGFGF